MSPRRHIPSKFDARFNEKPVNREQCKKSINYYRTSKDDEIPRNTEFIYEYGPPRNNSTLAGKRNLDISDTDSDASTTYRRNTKRMKRTSEWSAPLASYTEPLNLTNDRLLRNEKTYAIEYDEGSLSNYVGNRSRETTVIENDVKKYGLVDNIRQELRDYIDRKLESILLDSDDDGGVESASGFKPMLSDVRVRDYDVKKQNKPIIGKMVPCPSCGFKTDNDDDDDSNTMASSECREPSSSSRASGIIWSTLSGLERLLSSIAIILCFVLFLQILVHFR